jgi:hypothetical protein
MAEVFKVDKGGVGGGEDGSAFRFVHIGRGLGEGDEAVQLGYDPETVS